MTSTLEQELRAAVAHRMVVQEVGDLGGFIGAMLVGDEKAVRHAGALFGENACLVRPATILALLDRQTELEKALKLLLSFPDDEGYRDFAYAVLNRESEALHA